MISALCGRAGPPQPESIVWYTPSNYPHGLTTDGTYLWSADYGNTNLYKLDPASGAIVTQFSLSTSAPRGLAWDGTSVWMATASRLYEIDPSDGHPIRYLTGPGSNHQGLTYEGGKLWVANRNEDIYRVNPADGTVETNFAAPAGEPRGLTWHDGSLWNLDSTQDRIYQINPSNGAVLSSFLAHIGSGRGITWLSNRFWMAEVDDAQIIGFPTQHVAHGVLATPYVNKGTYYHGITNDSGWPVLGLHVYIAVPEETLKTDILSRRWLLNFVETAPDALYTDEFGQAVADFNIGTLPNGGAVAVAMEHVALMWDWTVQVDTGQVGDLGTISAEITNLYCRNEEKYVLDDIYIQTTAVAAVEGTSNAYEMAVRIHDYVAEHVTYDMSGGWDDAKTVLQRGTGSCSEYSFAMIALCRAVGLPARYAGGSEPRSFMEGRTDTAYHRWVEACIPGYGWVPFDATSDTGTTALDRKVGSANSGLILRRGGGSNEWLRWNYTSRAACSFGSFSDGSMMVWEDGAWSEDGDFDGDGTTNAADAFPYDSAATTDSDGDGDPDSWNAGCGASNSISIPALVEDLDDDNDGMSDEDEGVAGTSPTNASDFLYVDLALSGSDAVLEWPCVSGKVYRVWWCTNDLVFADWIADGSCATSQVTGTRAWTNAAGASPACYRIEVW